MRRRLRTGRAAVGLLLLIQFAFAAETPAPHIHNFGQVNQHFYRGAAPSVAGLEELGAMGIKMVIDLRESGENTDFERKEVERLHMKYVNVPFPPFSAPTQEQIQHVLALLMKNGSDTIFVHCRRGKDRTGTVVACYRIQHDNWDNQRALREARQYGMSMMERGMHSFILHFTPSPASVFDSLAATR